MPKRWLRIPWLLNRWAAFPLVWLFCLPGGAVLVEIVRDALRPLFVEPGVPGPKIPLPVEAALICGAALVLALGLFGKRMLARSLGWAIALLGHAALANALSPGRDAQRQLVWLGVGTALGAVVGLLAGPRRQRVPVQDPTAETPNLPSEPAATSASPRRRRIAPAATVLVFAVLAVLAVRYGLRVATQARITESVALAQGHTVYDHPSTPTLLFKWLDLLPRGDDHFCLSSVELGPNAGNDELAELAAKGLGSLPHLCELRLRRSLVTDDGLAVVTTLPNLRRISLGRATTDAGMPFLDDCPALQFLDLTSTQITGAGLRSACHLHALAHLNLERTRILDDDLSHLKAYPELVCLDLSATSITDSGLPHLKELPKLSSLVLAGTAITDAGLTHLTDLPQLRWLFLTGTKVTPAGLDNFHRRRPGVWTD